VKYDGCTIEQAIEKGAEKLYEKNKRWWERPNVDAYKKYVGTI